MNNSTMDKLSLAKEMFILGAYHGGKNSRVDRMLSILNFDFSVSTIIVTTCMDSGKNPKNNKGKAKGWPELITLLREFYTNENVVTNVDNLHEVRNQIQHGGSIPSEYDIQNYQKTVRNFFDEICHVVYQDKINFDSISLASLLKSPHEKEMLLKAEIMIEQGRYDFSLQLILTAAYYHYMLIRTNLRIPRFPTDTSQKTVEPSAYEVGKDVEKLSKDVNRAIDILAMGQYYFKTMELLNKTHSRNTLEYSYSWISKLQIKETISYDVIEKARIDIYNIILGTEHLVAEKTIVDVPVVYGLCIEEITANSARINYGILGKLNLEECVLQLFSDKDKKIS